MLGLPIYGNQKLALAFEFGVVLGQVAQDLKIEVTPEMVARAEKVLAQEFPACTAQNLAVMMTPLVLAILEPDESTAS